VKDREHALPNVAEDQAERVETHIKSILQTLESPHDELLILQSKTSQWTCFFGHRDWIFEVVDVVLGQASLWKWMVMPTRWSELDVKYVQVGHG